MTVIFYSKGYISLPVGNNLCADNVIGVKLLEV